MVQGQTAARSQGKYSFLFLGSEKLRHVKGLINGVNGDGQWGRPDIKFLIIGSKYGEFMVH